MAEEGLISRRWTDSDAPESHNGAPKSDTGAPNPRICEIPPKRPDVAAKKGYCPSALPLGQPLHFLSQYSRSLSRANLSQDSPSRRATARSPVTGVSCAIKFGSRDTRHFRYDSPYVRTSPCRGTRLNRGFTPTVLTDRPCEVQPLQTSRAITDMKMIDSEIHPGAEPHVCRTGFASCNRFESCRCNRLA